MEETVHMDTLPCIERESFVKFVLMLVKQMLYLHCHLRINLPIVRMSLMDFVNGEKLLSDFAILHVHKSVCDELDLDAVANDFIGRCTVRRNTFHV